MSQQSMDRKFSVTVPCIFIQEKKGYILSENIFQYEFFTRKKMEGLYSGKLTVLFNSLEGKMSTIQDKRRKDSVFTSISF